jgi:hypothetical protein
MRRKINGKFVWVAVISHKRPDSIIKMHYLIGDFTVYVNKGEKKTYEGNVYKQGFTAYQISVVECGEDICTARNEAIKNAICVGLPCFQLSDDLRSIKVIAMKNAKRTQIPISFEKVVALMLNTMEEFKIFYGGVAVTNNGLNYQGKDIDYDKLIVNDFICVRPTPHVQLQFFDVTLALKEDYDMCIRHLIHYGGVLRLNNILCTFPHRENKGGANTYRNEITEGAATKQLIAKWGPHVKPHATREGQVSLNYKVIEQTRQRFLNSGK